MPQITIQYSSPKTLKILTDLATYFNFKIIPQSVPEQPTDEQRSALPIDFASSPDFTALAGIWKDKEITLEDLREKAWGDRK